MTEAATSTTTNRWIPFEAGFNFRDLGGYPTRDGSTVRWGRLFRADTLHRLTQADLVTLDQLGLRTVVDLRASTEIDEFGRLDETASRDLAWHHVPMLDVVVLRARDDDETEDRPAASDAAAVVEPGAHYVELLGTGGAAARVVSILAREEGLPAAFHCTAGRDRTGMIAAIVLDLLGVPDEVIADDYVLTNEARARSDAWIVEHEPSFATYLAQFSAEQRITRPAVILGFLAGVRDRHGSVEAMLLDGGVDAADLDRLRINLLG